MIGISSLSGTARAVVAFAVASMLIGTFVAYRHALIERGVQQERTVWQERERQRLAAEESVRRSDARQANQLAEKADTRVRELRTIATRLTEDSHAHRSLIVSAAAPADCAGPVAAAVPDAADARTADQPAITRGALDQRAEPGGGGPADARITAHALRLWNSALTGTDVGAGACSADDPAGPACAVDTGIGLGAVWRNHIANATACAEDRARHNALIDLIEARQARAGALIDNKREP